MKKFKSEIILWKLESKSNRFGFFIPNERSYYGGDFFVNTKNFHGAVDGDKVRVETIEGNGRKPEVKILEVITGKPTTPQRQILKVVEWVYSWGNGDFGFVDVAGEEKGYFVYGKKKNGATEGDRVKAEIVKYNGKEEGIIIEILDQQEVFIEWKYSDNDTFGFVLPDDKSGDIFIPWSKKGEAENNQRVRVKIIKQWGRRREGIVIDIL